jgi:hypothetical protein
MKKISNKANRQRRAVLVRQGLMTKQFPFGTATGKGRDNRPAQRKLRRVYHDVFFGDLVHNWQLKKPQGGKLVPEILSGTCIDMYYGKNVDDQPPNLPPNQVLRYAYATGTGTGTIGQDPHTRQILPWKSDFTDLVEYGKEAVKQKSFYTEAEKLEIIRRLDNCNGASVKWYLNVVTPEGKTEEKTTSWHADNLYKKTDNTPIQGANSQVDNSHVAIMTWGGQKRFYMGKGEGPKHVNGNTCFYWDQCTSKMILLHGNDEKWIQGTLPPLRHFHCSGMHPDAMDKVVMSIMFRHIEATALVDRETNRLINPPVRADIAEFDAIHDTW